jgi:uncharacterized membrane protein YtjA (UPF0391 family)
MLDAKGLVCRESSGWSVKFFLLLRHAEGQIAAMLWIERNLNKMISWAITFLIIAIIAAVLGFGGIAGTAVGIAKLLFFVFLALFVISLLMGRRTPPVA